MPAVAKAAKPRKSRKTRPDAKYEPGQLVMAPGFKWDRRIRARVVSRQWDTYGKEYSYQVRPAGGSGMIGFRRMEGELRPLMERAKKPSK